MVAIQSGQSMCSDLVMNDTSDTNMPTNLGFLAFAFIVVNVVDIVVVIIILLLHWGAGSGADVLEVSVT